MPIGNSLLPLGSIARQCSIQANNVFFVIATQAQPDVFVKVSITAENILDVSKFSVIIPSSDAANFTLS